MKKKISLLLLITQLSFAQSNLNCKKAADNNRIVAAGGSVTEILYLLEQSKKIVAADVTSVYPKEVKHLPSIGYVRNLSSEGILSVSPTLILGEDDMGPPNVIEQLNNLSVDVRIIKEIQNSNGILEKIECISNIVNVKKENKRIITDSIVPAIISLNEIKSKNETLGKRVMLILSMKGTSPIIAGNNTSGNSFIKMIGAKNIYESVEGWQAVSEESIINYNPDFIIIPQKDLHKNSNISSIKNNKIFAKTNAGKNNGFISDDGMAILGFGPRTIFSALKAAKIINQQ